MAQTGGVTRTQGRHTNGMYAQDSERGGIGMRFAGTSRTLVVGKGRGDQQEN